jgi:hypothetical protein
MNKHLFIDLEETLIDTWDNFHLGPVNRINALLDEHFPGQRPSLDATVWSFAVWNDKDRDHFNKTMRDFLGGIFGLNFVRVITCEEMIEAIVAFKGFAKGSIDMVEMSQIWGKEGSFECWVRLNEGPGHFVLIDDVVPNRTVLLPDNSQTIQSVRV